MHRKLPAAFVLLAVAGSATLLAAGCDDAGQVQSLENDVAELRTKAKRLEGERDKLATRLDNAERRLAGLQEDLMQVRKDAQSASSSAAAAVGEAAKAGADATGTTAPVRKFSTEVGAAAKELADYFATEDGSRVFDVAMKAYEAKQQEERGSRMVKGMIDAFAQKANLTPQQTTQMEKIVGKAMTDIGGVWRSMRDPAGTPEERASRRSDAVAKTEEIRRATEDEVKGVLDSTQFEMYQQESARMRGLMGGGMGGPGGGMGGPRGQ